jgi:hypothetical protein
VEAAIDSVLKRIVEPGDGKFMIFHNISLPLALLYFQLKKYYDWLMTVGQDFELQSRRANLFKTDNVQRIPFKG